ANARHKATTGRYHIQANPIIKRLIDIDTDIVNESIAIIPQRNEEFWINIRRITPIIMNMLQMKHSVDSNLVFPLQQNFITLGGDKWNNSSIY
ncbi:GSCOCG00007577001-RA-CDS, partial [Cotesia congregata]